MAKDIYKIMPWENPDKSYFYKSYRRGKIKKTVQYIRDNERLKLRKGDIIKFNSGIIDSPLNDWRDWFLKPADKKELYNYDKRIPKYARNQFAIVMARYKITKYKYREFSDYGLVLMMLTGKKVGHIRKFYTVYNALFRKKYSFSDKVMQKNFKNKLNQESIKILTSKHNKSEESRNLLLSRLYKQLAMKGIK